MLPGQKLHLSSDGFLGEFSTAVPNPSESFMPCQPLSQFIADGLPQCVRLIATDMDGTLTQQGKFTPSLLQALEDLAAADIKVLIVTGRSAGWVSGLVSYLPLVGVIAENGGLFYPNDSEAPIALTPLPDLNAHRRHLAEAFTQLQTEFPQISESADNCFRLTDWTFDVRGLSQVQLQRLGSLCHHLGWGFTYSNVQCHIKPLNQDKATGLLQVWHDRFPEYTEAQIVTVGDSPNDETLFNPSFFPVSVGVANVLRYTNQLTHLPTYVTTAAEGEGFGELAKYLLDSTLGIQAAINSV